MRYEDSRPPAEKAVATGRPLTPETELSRFMPPEDLGKSVSVNEAGRSLASFSLRELWEYRELLYFMTWRDIKVRYKQTAMGAAWAIIQPLFMMLIFSVFFGLLIGVPTEDMPHLLFFYCGLLPWTFFANGVVNGSMSLVNNSNLITKVYFPRILVPVAATAAGLVDLLIASVILLGLAVYYGVPLGWGLFVALPLLLALCVLLTLGVCMWLAALVVKYRDIRHVLPFALQAWMFLTPIIYPIAIVPRNWQWVVHINPLTGIVENIRAALMGRPFDSQALWVSISITGVSLLVAVYTFRRIEKSFADLI
jgi:lipopolysaccharide transport system permease protein